MRIGTSALALYVCLATCVFADAVADQTPKTDVERAIDEFKVQTAAVGVRADSTRKPDQQKSILRQWHGRLYENLRNDFLDAVPHEIIQRGETKSLLRRNQFGFNIAGPFALPWLRQALRGTL